MRTSPQAVSPLEYRRISQECQLPNQLTSASMATTTLHYLQHQLRLPNGHIGIHQYNFRTVLFNNGTDPNSTNSAHVYTTKGHLRPHVQTTHCVQKYMKNHSSHSAHSTHANHCVQIRSIILHLPHFTQGNWSLTRIITTNVVRSSPVYSPTLLRT